MEFSTLAETFSLLEQTTKRLKKTKILSELLKKTPKADLEAVLILIDGRVFPAWDERELGISSQLAIKIISSTTGASSDTITNQWKKEGDLGIVTENLLKKQKQLTLTKETLTVKKIFTSLQKIPTIEGKGSIDKKVSIVSELLNSATPQEGRYLIKIVIGNLRAGIAAGSIRDAIVWAYFEKDIKFHYDEKENNFTVDRTVYERYTNATQHAYDVTNDFGLVAELAKEEGIKGLENASIIPGKALNVMLYQKAKNIHDAFETVGVPAACEYKYDGFHVLLNYDGKEIKLFTRRLEDVTKQFPDVVDVVKKHITAKTFIIDAEIIGYDPKTKKYLPFQQVSQRIKRKYDIEEISKKFPVEIIPFDCLYINGESTLLLPFSERRKLLEKYVNVNKGSIQLAKHIITDDEEAAGAFYTQALADGQEGIMVKNLNAEYKPGSRVGYGLKVKPVLEGLDVVIVGAEYGEGKRSGWLSSFIIAVRDENKFVEIGRVGTGFKEKTEGVTFDELTETLKPLITETDGKVVRVKAKVIIEVNFEEIQASPSYSSGYALRFPRVIRLRPDKGVRDISTLKDVKKIYNEQRGRDETK